MKWEHIILCTWCQKKKMEKGDFQLKKIFFVELCNNLNCWTSSDNQNRIWFTCIWRFILMISFHVFHILTLSLKNFTKSRNSNKMLNVDCVCRMCWRKEKKNRKYNKIESNKLQSKWKTEKNEYEFLFELKLKKIFEIFLFILLCLWLEFGSFLFLPFIGSHPIMINMMNNSISSILEILFVLKQRIKKHINSKSEKEPVK